MTLSPGARLGSFEILSALGAGGMGEVYRARDTKLGREVAVKVLPALFVADSERVARFRREARTLAALSHPNIGGIYGLEEANDVTALVLELVEGPTLADRITRGPLSVEEALPIATQIAEALEAAHEKGIVHRDLKPANVKVTTENVVKVLDFGLARAAPPNQAQPDATQSPTLSVLATQAGVILGTAAYMSPEQAKGFPADHRSDVFSFGIVLHEMLTGRRPFQGETAAEIMASVLVQEVDLSAVPTNLNPRLIELLQRCLAKSPKKRWQAIGDVRAELESIAQAPRRPVAMTAPLAPPLWRRGVLMAVTALIASGVGGAAVWMFRPPAQRVVTRLAFMLPEQETQTNPGRSQLAISPDGTKIVYVANFRLYLRSLADFESRPIHGSEPPESAAKTAGVTSPAFSPDGQLIAFFSTSDNTIKTISVNGGTVVTICPATNPLGLSWGRNGIIFGQGTDGIMRVSPSGGIPERLVGARADEVAHVSEILPDGDSLLLTVTTDTTPERWDKGRIIVQSLRSGERKTLVEGGSDGHYAPSGHLVYANGGVAFAAPFDLGRLQTTGPSVRAVEGVRRAGASSAAAQLAFSSSGSLVYLPGPAASMNTQRDLAWVDRSGAAERLKLPVGPYQHARISRDGKRIAFGTDDGKEANVHTYAPDSGTSPQRLTFAGINRFPIWSADGERIAFQSDREGDRGIFWQAANGGVVERLTKAEQGTSHVPEAWSSTGDWLLYTVTRGSLVTLWTLALKDKAATQMPGVESSTPIGSVFSPDGQWIAYGINNTIYVQPFPPTGSTYQVSRTNGGHHPIWSSDGKELYYEPGQGQFVAVAVRTKPSFAVGSAVPLPGALGSTAHVSARNRDVAPGGLRFISPVPTESATVSEREIRVVLNWFDELKQRAPDR